MCCSQVGPQIFPRILKPKDLSFLDESADGKDDVEVPEPGTKIGSDMRRLLDYTEPWTTNPDYQRVRTHGWKMARLPTALPGTPRSRSSSSNSKAASSGA